MSTSETLESPAVSVIGSSTPATTTSAPNELPINIDDDGQEDDEEQTRLSGKRAKKCTSWVWTYFTKKKEYVEVNGNQVEEIWGHCNFARCDQKYRAAGVNGTTAFKNHLKSKHSVVKGQQQLHVGKNPGSQIVLDLYLLVNFVCT
jgi:hypothetical protein